MWGAARSAEFAGGRRAETGDGSSAPARKQKAENPAPRGTPVRGPGARARPRLARGPGPKLFPQCGPVSGPVGVPPGPGSCVGARAAPGRAPPPPGPGQVPPLGDRGPLPLHPLARGAMYVRAALRSLFGGTRSAPVDDRRREKRSARSFPSFPSTLSHSLLL